MKEKNNNGTNAFYAIIGVATLVVAIIGATFAYFSATANSEDGDIQGKTNDEISTSLTLNVEKVKFQQEDVGDLVPTDLTPDEAGIGKAVAAKCIGSGYTGCHLYKITASSTQSIEKASIRIASLSVTAVDKESWKYVVYKSDNGEPETVTSIVNSGGSSFKDFDTTYGSLDPAGFDIHSNGSLDAGSPVYYYLLIYLANKDATQNPTDEMNSNPDNGTGSYTGTVTMDALGGKVAATFAARG